MFSFPRYNGRLLSTQCLCVQSLLILQVLNVVSQILILELKACRFCVPLVVFLERLYVFCIGGNCMGSSQREYLIKISFVDMSNFPLLILTDMLDLRTAIGIKSRLLLQTQLTASFIAIHGTLRFADRTYINR